MVIKKTIYYPFLRITNLIVPRMITTTPFYIIHHVRAAQKEFFPIVHPILQHAVLTPNTQKYTKMENEIMRIESTTIRHRIGNRQSNIPIDKKDILAIETGSTQYDNWMTIWYEVKT